MADENQNSSRKNGIQEIKEQVVDKLSTLITSAFGLVAALAWNAAIQKIFATLFGSISELYAELLYAISVTVIAVVVTIYVGRLAGKLK